MTAARPTLGMLMERLVSKGEKVTRVRGGWVTRCPACGVDGALLILGKPDTPFEASRIQCAQPEDVLRAES